MFGIFKKSVVKKVLRKIKRIIDPYFGKYIDTLYWKYNYIFFDDWKKGYLDESSLNHPHRMLIVKSVQRIPNVKSLLELGTGNGTNLILLNKYFPKISYTGIDINTKAINIGRYILREKNLQNITLIRDNINSIKKIKSSSYDVALTDAVLCYLDPKAVNLLINEILRIVRYRLIMCEQASDESKYEDLWLHNYKTILKNNDQVKSYKTSSISRRYWDNKWIENGLIIEVEKKDEST